ncbi:MAG: LacI family DNA-binding transcriptional regulator [Bacteroidota bacterium]
MTITINEVANLARVSPSTVSRVLNRTGPFSPKVEKAVLEAVKMLNYQPSAVARGLAKRRTMSIGVIVPDIRNPFYAQICWRAEQIAKSNGYTIIICNIDNDPMGEDAYLRVMKDRRVDGILLTGSVKDATKIINFKIKEEIPVVLLDLAVEGYDIPYVVLNNYNGAKLMTDYLVSLGHERIVFATSDATPAERTRLEGFLRTMLEKGHSVKEEMVVTLSETKWRQKEFGKLEELLSRPLAGRPTAVFCSNDLKAIFMYELAHRLKLNIPRDITVVGYDDIEIVRWLGPPLTTVAQPIDAMTIQGTEMLLAEIKGESFKKRIEMMPELVIRRSARSPAGSK